jgi:hypothetical protein
MTIRLGHLTRWVATASLAALASLTALAADAPPPAEPGSSAASVAPAANGPATSRPAKRRRDEVGALPYDLRYSELSPAQKDIVRSTYESLAADDEPPYPAKGIGVLMRPLHASAGWMHMDGWVDAIVDIDAHGVPLAVTIYKSPTPLITQLVGALLMENRYKPGLCKGQPCRMPFALRVDLAAR